MTYSPMRFAWRSCSSSGQRRQLRPRRLKTKIRPEKRAEAPAAAEAAAAEGAAGSGVAAVADAADDVDVDVAGARNSPDNGNQCTG